MKGRGSRWPAGAHEQTKKLKSGMIPIGRESARSGVVINVDVCDLVKGVSRLLWWNWCYGQQNGLMTAVIQS